MHVFHTVGVPPSSGNSIRAIIGCTQNNSSALVKIAVAKSHAAAAPDWLRSSPRAPDTGASK